MQGIYKAISDLQDTYKQLDNILENSIPCDVTKDCKECQMDRVCDNMVKAMSYLRRAINTLKGE